ncbi:MAG TPA: 2-succinyl-5-enolpyruvyl-6-hydroxy-3-cyclohexene-1-carboxylic-acid synthase [Porphyromonadaceae bacterium]|jgi:2-succinyl-5-enolpyruvyl-6-hydroxy-3-cyclohexene-1-carboxylate synthase|nr:2-succinyl-5-enolpyruvyl-6-hydroxy-3-cyclohexene-1-carboxylic-acid synthase [Porphyromonadaceae bacterium]
MYSDKKSVLELVALLKAHGITQIVLSPGSRNSPLIHSFAVDTDFKCYSVVDERSAGFFALGVIQATGKPVAVCCTSGTATLNLAPAVAEAFYQQLPLLVISADRTPEWIGQMDGQTVPQSGVFGQLVHRSVQLPVVKDNDDLWYCNRLINDAILNLDKGKKGPVHINTPINEPLFSFNVENLPQVRVIRRPAVNINISEKERYKERFLHFSKRMIIVGQLPPNNNLSDILSELSSVYNVVVLSDHLSNISKRENKCYDIVIRSANNKELSELSPELLITIGGHTVSKKIKQFIRDAGVKEHWHISPSGQVIDTFQNVTEIVTSDYRTFLSYISESIDDKRNRTKQSTGVLNESIEFKKTWRDKCASISESKVEYSDLYATGLLLNALPKNISLQLANSHSVYLAQLFDIPVETKCFSNRGTNGIEGSLSTAVGYSAASEKLTLFLTGDLSFFYDMNAIWNHHISPNLRIVVNNNGGGGIFDTLPGLNKSEAMPDYIKVAHNTSAKEWAEQQGFIYLSAYNSVELKKHIAKLFDPKSDSPVILEVFTTIENNSLEIKSFFQQKENNKL